MNHCKVTKTVTGFQVLLQDLYLLPIMKNFAYHERILLGAVDEYGCLLVKEIIGNEIKTVLEHSDSVTFSSVNNYY